MFTQEDLKPHETSSVLMWNQNHELLVMDHRKHGMIAPVIGKCHTGETPVQAIIREAQEEVGVTFRESGLLFVGSYTKQYDFGGTKVWVKTNVFNAFSSWTGEIRNMEPEKHYNLRFLGLADLFALEKRGLKVADVIRFALHLLP